MKDDVVRVTLWWREGGRPVRQDAVLPAAHDVADLRRALAERDPAPAVLSAGPRRPCYAGPLRQWAQGHDGGCLRLQQRHPPDLRPLRIAWQDRPLWQGHVLPGHGPADVWRQLRAADPRLPPWDHCVPEPADDGRAVRVGLAYDDTRVIPVLPADVAPLVRALDRPADALPRLAHWNVCPTCRRALLDPVDRHCLGSVRLCRLRGRLVARTPLPCAHVPALTYLQEDDLNDAGERDRFNSGSEHREGRYTPNDHIGEVLATAGAAQPEPPPAPVLRDVQEALHLDRRPATRAHVFEALRSLNRWYPHVYDRHYRDAAKIAMVLRHDPRPAGDDYLRRPPRPVPHAGLPGHVAREVRRLAALAVQSWRRAPPRIRRGRSNFLRTDFNVHVLLGIAAALHRDRRYLAHRRLFGRGDGEAPHLCDSAREHDFTHIWAWIAQDQGWPPPPP